MLKPIALLSTALLMAFGPDDATRIQQPPPQSWIPPVRPDPAPPPVVTPETPVATPEACRGSGKAREAFVHAYSRSTSMLKDRRFAEALAAANDAMPHAEPGAQQTAVWSVRVAANAGLGDLAAQLEALETIVALGCDPGAAARHEPAIRGLRNQLGLPPAPAQPTP